MNRLQRFLAPALALLALTCAAPALAAETGAPVASPIDGTWRWTFTMPDGSTVRPKLILETENGVLTGTTSFRPGTETAITNVVLLGSQLRFQVVRRRNGQDIVTTYWGTRNGRIIRGKVESNWAGEKQIYDWEARRAHEGAEGLWRWTAVFRGRKFEARVRLEQDGGKLEGSVPGSGRGPRRIRIQNGSVKDDEVHFEIERGAGEGKVVTIYHGKQSGDTIRGTITTVAGGRKRDAKWEAQRVDLE